MKKQVVFGISGLLSLVVFLILSLVISRMTSGLEAQNMVRRWSEKNDTAQVSSFFSLGTGVTEDAIAMFERSLDGALEQASIEADPGNAGARLWLDAYSADGRITISSERSTIDVKAVGVGGDFFRFHPLHLLSGGYFSGSDLMRDHIVLDEDAAWQLFGSSDIEGKWVTIAGVPHMVSGVVEREQGRLESAAGLDSSLVYVSYETLNKYGADYGINCYEIVMPNPVSGYAKQYVMDNIGVSENNVEVVENSRRFSLASRFKLLAQSGYRSMNSKGIIYPYWENLARGYEDITGFLFLLALLFLLYPVVLFVIALVVAWKRRTWTVKSLWTGTRDKAERLLEKSRKKRHNKNKVKEINKEEQGIKGGIGE